ncbi:MAG TPA: hypothetical protein VHR35_03025 [Nocardioides sp.]|jgi:hypothetical protein|nr:hypothetical protein [Nocardioides sp.]
MSVRTKHLKLVGVGSAVALAVGAVAAPALAAGTASVNYTCTTPLTPATPTADYTVDTAPATMVVGQPLSTTAAFTLDPGTTALAQGLGWVTFKGTITTKPSGSQAGLALKFPKTTLGTGAGGSTDAAAKGATLAGTKVGAFTFVLGDLGDVKLTGFDSGGKKVGTVEFPTTGSFGPCINDAGTTTLMDGGTPVTTTLVKDASKTAVAAKYVAKKKTTVAVAKVSGKVGHLPGTGKVKFALKKGTHTLKTVSGTLNKKGIAKVAIKKPLVKGKYVVKAKFGGDARLKASSGKDRFTVR